MMDAIEKLLFTSDEAKRWIYHPLMQTAQPHTLHQYKRHLNASGNQLLSMIPVDLPMNMNSLPLAPAQQWQHLRWTIKILAKLTRADIPSGSTVFDELVSYATRMLDS